MGRMSGDYLMQCDESVTIYPPSAAKLGSHIPARGLLSLAYNDTLWSLRLPRLTQRYPKPQSRVGMLGTVDRLHCAGYLSPRSGPPDIGNAPFRVPIVRPVPNRLK